MNELAIYTEGLTRRFDGLTAVDRLDLRVPAGIIFGFLGPNGAGKTTTIRLLLGLLAPSGGMATVLGYDTITGGDEIRARSGALLEHPGHYDRLSALQNLAFYGRIWHLPPGELRERSRTLLDHFGLWERRDESVGTWSRGMRQKLAVARALLHRPSLIFLDEPTAGLDPVAAANLRDDLVALAASEGVTVFLTTHNLAEAEKICDHVGVIRRGRLVAVGPPAELTARSRANRVVMTGRGFDERVIAALRGRPEVLAVSASDGQLRVELQDGVDTAPLVTLVVSQGGEVAEVQKEQGGLEEAFLALMEEAEEG